MRIIEVDSLTKSYRSDALAIQLPSSSLKPFQHKTLEERAAEFDGKLMLDGEYDWGEPVADYYERIMKGK